MKLFCSKPIDSWKPCTLQRTFRTRWCDVVLISLSQSMSRTSHKINFLFVIMANWRDQSIRYFVTCTRKSIWATTTTTTDSLTTITTTATAITTLTAWLFFDWVLSDGNPIKQGWTYFLANGPNLKEKFNAGLDFFFYFTEYLVFISTVPTKLDTRATKILGRAAALSCLL